MQIKKFVAAHIDDLQLDPFHEMLPERLQGTDEKSIIEHMLRDADLFDLINSIGAHDYYPGEPLLVIEAEEKGKYIVIAGNRRLASCKIIRNTELANVKNKRINNRVGETVFKYKPLVLPAFVFDKREDIPPDLNYFPGPQRMNDLR